MSTLLVVWICVWVFIWIVCALSKETEDFISSGIICFMIAFPIVAELYQTRYKDGQIDALRDEVKYELVVHDDSTRTWERINRDDR